MGPKHLPTLQDDVYGRSPPHQEGCTTDLLNETMDKEKEPGAPDIQMVEGQLVVSKLGDAELAASVIWSALNSQTRMGMRQVCRQPTCTEQLIMCTALHPVVHLNARLHQIDERSWELKQQAKFKDSGTRKFRLVETAKGSITEGCWT